MSNVCFLVILLLLTNLFRGGAGGRSDSWDWNSCVKIDVKCMFFSDFVTANKSI